MRQTIRTSLGMLNRRQVLAGLGTLAAVPNVASACECEAKPKPGTVRDRFWLNGYAPGSDYFWTAKRSVMSPAEAAYYICVPNVVMVQVYGLEAKYGRFEPPYDRYAIALRPFKRALWSIVGSGGFTDAEERLKVIDLAKTTPNFTGVWMDDFFTFGGGGWQDVQARDPTLLSQLMKKEEPQTEQPQTTGKVASLSTDEIAQIQRQLKGAGKKLDLYVAVYTYQLDPKIVEYLNLIDVISLWTSDSKDLMKLESNLEKLEKLAPKIRKMLGIYTIDYPNRGGPVPIPLMKHQCALGLKWLHEGRVEDLMFLGNGHYDIGYDSVEWLRDWIRDVADATL